MVEHAGHDRVVGRVPGMVRPVEAVRRLVDAVAVGMEGAAGLLRPRGVGKFLHAERGHDAEIVGVGNVQTVLALGIIQRRQAAVARVILVGRGRAVRIGHLRQVTAGVVAVVRAATGVVRHAGEPVAAVGQVRDRLVYATVNIHNDLHEPVVRCARRRLPCAAVFVIWRIVCKV